MNFITYRLEVRNVHLNKELKINYKNDYISRIEVTIKELKDKIQNEMEIKLVLKDELEENKNYLIESQGVIDNIINLLVYKTKGVYGVPRLGPHNVNTQNMLASGSITIFNEETHDIYKELSSIIIDHLDNVNLVSALNNNDLHILFRSANRAESAIARFMFLYSILFESSKVVKTNDIKSQSDVDKFIQSIDKNVLMKPSTMKHRKSETIYTWLRNQIGHTQSKSDPLVISIEVEKYVDSLSEVVKQAL